MLISAEEENLAGWIFLRGGALMPEIVALPKPTRVSGLILSFLKACSCTIPLELVA
jgi:hypothetical protein